MRGLHKSKPMDELLVEVNHLAAKGVKELIIIVSVIQRIMVKIFMAEEIWPSF
ncbi:MAG: hypothetical protein MZV64_03065 [Ignavibacteriales bacterium]|nr:hypothetical protein [Ignavibacteriales bacterium]